MAHARLPAVPLRRVPERFKDAGSLTCDESAAAPIG
jgi:hypothetical protein